MDGFPNALESRWFSPNSLQSGCDSADVNHTDEQKCDHESSGWDVHQHEQHERKIRQTKQGEKRHRATPWEQSAGIRIAVAPNLGHRLPHTTSHLSLNAYAKSVILLPSV